jgi:CRP/FNR family transcriptional regulator, cyclic AMP receptor protein
MPVAATRRKRYRVQIAKKRRLELRGAVWLFEQCSQRELDLLQRAVTLLDVPAGRALAEQGALGREFVVIVDGTAAVTRDGTQLAVLGPGSFFGEMSLLDGQPRAATVTTLEPTTVLVLGGAEFGAVVKTMPSVDRKMLSVLAARLRDIEAKYVPAGERNTNTDVG